MLPPLLVPLWSDQFENFHDIIAHRIDRGQVSGLGSLEPFSIIYLDMSLTLKSLPAATVREAGRFLDAAPNPRQRLPRVIQFPINDICNSRCQMCLIWKNKRQVELNPSEIARVMKNRVFSKVTAVGLNGGEPTLRKDLKDIAASLVRSLPSLKTISIITNAWKHERCNRRIEELARVCSDHGIALDVMISMDGVGEIHDRVRGRPGNFDEACKVLDYAQSDSRITTLRLGCTVVRDNVFGVEDLLQWARRRGVYARFRLGVPHKRLYNLAHLEPLTLSREERYHFAVFLDNIRLHYEPQPARRIFYRSLRDQLVYDSPRRAGCAWKSRAVTLLSNGGMAYCAVESPTLGNVLEDDPSELYWGNSATLQRIVQGKCAGCAHDYEGDYSRKDVFLGQAQRLVDVSPPLLAGTLRASARWCRSVSRGLRVARARANRRPLSGKGALDRILLTGWYGTETAGDKAILAGLVCAIRELRPTASIDVASLEPYVTRQTASETPELEVVNVVSLDVARIGAGEGRYELVAVAGGPMMDIPEVVDLLEIQVAAHRAGSRTALLGCGIGPLRRPTMNVAIKTLVDVSDEVIVRDHASARSLTEILKSRHHPQVMVDPAFLWLDSSAPGGHRTREDKIVLALRDWPLNEYAKGVLPRGRAEEIKARFEQELLRFVDTIRTLSPGTTVKPICMHTLPVGGDDREFYRRLFREDPAIFPYIDTRHISPTRIYEEFRSAKAALTMRFHGLVFALAAGTHVLAIDYTLGGKVEALLSDLNRRSSMRRLADFSGESCAHDLLSAPEESDPVICPVTASRDVLMSTLRRLLPQVILESDPVNLR